MDKELTITVGLCDVAGALRENCASITYKLRSDVPYRLDVFMSQIAEVVRSNAEIFAMEVDEKERYATPARRGARK